MRDLEKFRNIAYYLLNDGNTKKSFEVYYRLYTDIWYALGKFKKDLNLTPAIILNYESDDLKNLISQSKLKKILFERFRLTTEKLIDEFLYITYGKMKVICYSPKTIPKLTYDSIINDALLYFIILLNKDEINTVKRIFEFFNPLISNDSLHSIKLIKENSIIEKEVIKLIDESLDKNFILPSKMLLNILFELKYTDSKIFQYLVPIYQDKTISLDEFKEFELQQENSRKLFDPHKANDKEKAVYYGKVLGLIGKVKKSEIREKYHSKMNLFHPDKLKNPTSEVLKLIESKTKEINQAFDYFKEKYNI